MSSSEIIHADSLFSERKGRENDLFTLLEALTLAKKQLIGTTCFFALIGLIIAMLLPQKWTSVAVISPADQIQLAELRDTIASLKAKNIDISGTRDDVFNYFLKEVSSRSQFEEWLISTPAVLETLIAENEDADAMHRAIVAMADTFKVENSADPKSADDHPYKSWTLRFTDSQPEQAQLVLRGYLQFVSAKLQKTIVGMLESQLHAKISYDKEKLDAARTALLNERDAKIQRLKYALIIANAAGIKSPVYSEGQAVHDDPDYAVTLGANGLNAKLEVEKSIQDVSSISPTLRNQEYQLTRLEATKIPKMDFVPFAFLQSPSLPVKHEGPGKGFVTLIAGLLGLLFACGCILLRQAIADRR